MSKFNIGDKVKYIGKEHEETPEFYPVVGTVGLVKRIDSDGYYWVQWPKGTTSNGDCWCCDDNDIELIIKNINLSNEEIWRMLKNKMIKNGLISKSSYFVVKPTDPPFTNSPIIKTYDCDDVHNAIAIAYRSGYERAMKGWPFKFGEKKKKGGHWEPVDPDSLPKEGTRVRYSRECKDYSDCKIPLIILGDLGKVDITQEGWFGIRLDNPRSSYSWICFNDDRIANCLDMWVEDDE